MGYERRTWDLGNIKEIEERHTWTWHPPNLQRKKKEKPTAEAVRKNNQRLAARKRRMQLELYFGEDDCYFTLTYPKDGRPANMEEVQKDWTKLMQYVSRVFRKHGAVLRWIRNIEAGSKGAWHIHAVVKELPPGAVDSDGRPTTIAKLISKLWQKKMGHGRVDTQYLQSDVSALAEYITKNPQSSEGTGHKVIASNCSASRNMPLPEPEVRTYSRWKTFVDRDIKVPKGWALDKSSVKESINPFTGYPRREYRLIRLEAKRRC